MTKYFPEKCDQQNTQKPWENSFMLKKKRLNIQIQKNSVVTYGEFRFVQAQFSKVNFCFHPPPNCYSPSSIFSNVQTHMFHLNRVN